MRGHNTGGAVFNLRVDVENGELPLGPPLLLVEVGHHVLHLVNKVLNNYAAGVYILASQKNCPPHPVEILPCFWDFYYWFLQILTVF